MNKPLLIIGSDKKYFDYLEANPSAFLSNIQSNRSPSYFVLHRTTCRTINGSTHKDKPGAFTERSYIKLVSHDLNKLEAWGLKEGFIKDRFKYCKTCKVGL